MRHLGRNLAGWLHRFEPILGSKVSAEIGAVAPVSDTLRMSGGSGMAPSSRDRISVDLRGLKAVLLTRAEALGVSPSGLVRRTLAEALGGVSCEAPSQAGQGGIKRSTLPHFSGKAGRTRLCLRMSREQARATMDAARRAGMHPGDYVGSLVANVPVLSTGGGRAEHIAALMASSAELSTLSRNIHRLTAVLRQADVESARPYREMLDTLAGDVRRHLELAARVLADLQPRGRGAKSSEPALSARTAQ